MTRSSPILGPTLVETLRTAPELASAGGHKQFETRHHLPLGFVQEVFDGAFVTPRLLADAVERGAQPLAALGAALKQDPQAWAEMLASEMLSVPSASLAMTLRGALLVHLLRDGQTLEELAPMVNSTSRSLRVLLSSGRSGGTLDQQALATAIGFKHPQAAAFSAAARDFFKHALTQLKLTPTSVAKDLGVRLDTIKQIIEGRTPPKIQPVLLTRLAELLRVSIDDMAHHLAMTWRSSLPRQSDVRYHVARWMFAHGVPLRGLSLKTSITTNRLVHIIGGAIATAEECEQLSSVLGLAVTALVQASQDMARQRQQSDRVYLKVRDSVPPLHLAVRDAADRAGLSDDEWAKQHGISVSHLHRLLNQGRAPSIKRNLRLYADALGWDIARLYTSIRRMNETREDQAGSQAWFMTVVPTTGLQETLLGLLRTKAMSPAQLAAHMSCDRECLTRLARYGIMPTKRTVLERIRRYLRVDHLRFGELVQPAEQSMTEDDDEVRLLRLYRLMHPDGRGILLQTAGRLLAQAHAGS